MPWLLPSHCKKSFWVSNIAKRRLDLCLNRIENLFGRSMCPHYTSTLLHMRSFPISNLYISHKKTLDPCQRSLSSWLYQGKQTVWSYLICIVPWSTQSLAMTPYLKILDPIYHHGLHMSGCLLLFLYKVCTQMLVNLHFFFSI